MIGGQVVRDAEQHQASDGRSAAASDAQTPAQLLQRHYRVLLHALQTGHPVIYQQRQRFIHTLSFHSSGGGVEADVYLAGQPDTIRPMEITLDPNYRKDYALK